MTKPKSLEEFLVTRTFDNRQLGLTNLVESLELGESATFVRLTALAEMEVEFDEQAERERITDAEHSRLDRLGKSDKKVDMIVAIVIESRLEEAKQMYDRTRMNMAALKAGSKLLCDKYDKLEAELFKARCHANDMVNAIYQEKEPKEVAKKYLKDFPMGEK